MLAATGKFTRFPDAPTFVPEVIRTPLYPVFVALLYRAFGVHQLPGGAGADRSVRDDLRRGVRDGAARRRRSASRSARRRRRRCFPPIPYFGALVMTEVLTTLLFTLAMWLALSALARHAPAPLRRRSASLLGADGAEPAGVRAVSVRARRGRRSIVLPLLRVPRRPRGACSGGAMFAAFALTMAPWFAYNYVTLGRFTLSPAGGIGRGLWEGSWQATWSGRTQNELTHLADDIDDRAELDRRVADVAAREHLPVAPMLEYVHQWEDIRLIWTEPTDP